ncbi:MAG: DUF554 family protein, partial [Anaerolineae bacterium]
MVATGTIINVATVLVGGVLGTLLGARLPERMRETIMHALGLLTIVIGVQLSLETANVLIVLGSLLLGGLAGELLRIEGAIDRVGQWLQERTGGAAPSADGTPSDRSPGTTTRF